MKAGGIQKYQLRVSPIKNATDAVAGCLRFIGHDGDLFTNDRIGKRGLADVRPTADRDHRRFRIHLFSPIVNS